MADLFSFYAFFEVCCFLFLVYCLYKVFKNYLITMIKEGLLQKEVNLSHLQNEFKEAQAEVAGVLAKREADKVKAALLLKKIKVWSNAEKNKTTALKEEKNLSAKEVQKYIEEGVRSLELEHAREEIIPEAIASAERALRSTFKSKKKQDEFLLGSLKILNMRNS